MKALKYIALLVILTVVLTPLCFIWYYGYYHPRHHFVRPKVIENITGVRLPKYKVVEYERGSHAFTGDYSADFVLEFKEIPSKDFYQLLNELYDHRTNSKGITEYTFDCMWGNGLPAPKGESDSDDYFFHIKIPKGSKAFYIESGAW